MKKILIIEDDIVVGNIYRNKLCVEGYEVEVARDGEAGLQTAFTFQPDLIILDLMLPKKNGLEVIEGLRAVPAFADVPIVVFSNTYLTNLVEKAWKMGAAKCLSKSNCTPKQLLEVVASLLLDRGAVGTADVGSAASDLPKPAIPPPPLNAAEAEAAFQADLRRTFFESVPAAVTALRQPLQILAKAENAEVRFLQLETMHRRIRALAANAGLAGLSALAQLGDAAEALVQELCQKPRSLTASTLRTLAEAIDFLGGLSDREFLPECDLLPASRILVVDDDRISRRAVSHALEKARLRSLNVADPHMALRLLPDNSFDLIFLDVDMPEVTGFELCAQLRKLPGYKKTPVVFVTNLNDFQSRAHSMISGGNDLIAKPFLFTELAVKALVLLLRAYRRKLDDTPVDRSVQ